MASLCRQIIRGNALKSLLFSSARRGYGDKMMPDPLEHATGMERKELMAMQAGNDDPFNMKVLTKAAGTRENPTLVPSCFDARIVGCIWISGLISLLREAAECLYPFGGFKTIFIVSQGAGGEEHSTSVTWLWVHKGHPRRCDCGHWYKLIEKELI